MNRSNDNRRTSVEDKLRAEHPQRQVPPGFSERVMQSIEASEESSQDEIRATRPLVFPRISFVLFAALTAIFFLKNGEEPAAPADPPTVATTESALPPLPALPALTSDQIEALTVKLQDPLHDELEFVISDTRQAIEFVASNFLPQGSH